MKMDGAEQLLIDGAKEIGIALDETQSARFIKYKNLLQQWNEKMNLTAIVEDKEIILKHFIDSISILPYMEIGRHTKIIDVGTGAGFPAVPVKIMCPGVNMTLLDSLNKRLVFLNEVISELGLSEIECVHLRAEDGGKNPELRERFDYSVARAVAELPILSELCLPFVKVGGFFLAMKGRESAGEIDEAKKAINILGGEIIDVKTVNIPFTDIVHSIIMIKKCRHTPSTFPRNMVKITKYPVK